MSVSSPSLQPPHDAPTSSAAAPPKKRGRRWRVLWQPLLRLSLGFCLGIFPTVFGACGGTSLLEGSARATPAPDEQEAWWQRGGARFQLPFNTVPAGNLAYAVALRVLGLSASQLDALRRTDSRYPHMTIFNSQALQTAVQYGQRVSVNVNIIPL